MEHILKVDTDGQASSPYTFTIKILVVYLVAILSKIQDDTDMIDEDGCSNNVSVKINSLVLMKLYYFR